MRNMSFHTLPTSLLIIGCDVCEVVSELRRICVIDKIESLIKPFTHFFEVVCQLVESSVHLIQTVFDSSKLIGEGSHESISNPSVRSFFKHLVVTIVHAPSRKSRLMSKVGIAANIAQCHRLYMIKC